MADFGLTDKGFVAKRFEDIVNDRKSQIQQEFGIDLDSNPDNALKIYTQILSLASSENWATTAALQSVMDIDNASDVYLDILCAAKLIYRQGAEPSRGDVLVEINEISELTLPAESSFYNVNNKQFNTEEIFTLSVANPQTVSITPEATYTGDINFSVAGASFSKNVTAEGGILQALQALRDDLLAVDYFAEVVDASTLKIRKIEDVGATSSDFSYASVSGTGDVLIGRYVTVAYTESGDFTFPEDTLTVAPSFSVIQSFYNKEITGGRYRETDEELRYRFKNGQSVLGNGTPSAIKSKLLGIDGVSAVSVEENHTMFEDSNGRPPKSQEIIVKGGEDVEVAQMILDSAAGGIELFGNTSVTIRDLNGDNRAVKFSRITQQYITLRIVFEKYDEEQFPANGAELIAQASQDYINSLNVGNDVIGGRISANIYNKVSGIEVVEVQMFVSDDPSQAATSYQTAPIRISTSQEAVCLDGKILVVEV